MKIGERPIGTDFPPLIIAELGINHGGELEVAKSMCRLARDAGAEAVKHQTHVPDDEMTPVARHIVPPNDPRSIWEVIEDSALTFDEEVKLKMYAESLGLIYLSTPFSRAAADFLYDIEIPAFKIGSGELSNIPLLRHVAGFRRPVILSTGMHDLGSVAVAVDILRSAGVQFALLECTNLYPSPPEAISLRGIEELRGAFPGVPVGFSDHSKGPFMAVAAIALGAVIVERHFTDSRYRSGPDIAASMDPAELRLLIDRGTEVWRASRNAKGRTVDEEAVYSFARSSVVADRDLEPGVVLGVGDVWARRPGMGEIPGSKFDEVLGRTLVAAKRRGDFIGWADLA